MTSCHKQACICQHEHGFCTKQKAYLPTKKRDESRTYELTEAGGNTIADFVCVAIGNLSEIHIS